MPSPIKVVRTIGYKVVRRNLDDPVDVFKSGFVGSTLRARQHPSISKLELDYVIGKITKPKVKGCPLFAFTELKDAQDYARFQYGIVFKAELINAKPNGWFRDLSLATFRELALIFKNREGQDYKKFPDRFKSSVVCSSIKLLERMS